MFEFTPMPIRRQGRLHARRNELDFNAIAKAALSNAQPILRRWLPDGVVSSHEYVARNPRRMDRRPGSFRINLRTGKWADFATGDCGGDLIALGAYLFSISQIEAARRITQMLGVNNG